MEEHDKHNKNKSSKIRLYILSILFFLSFFIGIFLALKEDKLVKPPSITSTFSADTFSLLKPSIRVIDVNGLIEYNAMVPYVSKRLTKIEKSKNIKAVILRLNSGGGTVGASQEIYHKIMKFKKETNKPVIAVFGDVAASGAYYIACASDYIFARRGTITGSIGVIFGGFTFEHMFKELGIKQEIVKSGKFKDIGSSIGRSKTKEELVLLQGIIDSTYKQFFDTVLEGRKGKISENLLKKYADGRIFNGEGAKAIGLVDEIGGVEEAKNYIKDKIGIDEVNIIEDDPFEDMLEKLLTTKVNVSSSITDFLKTYSYGIPLYLYLQNK